MSALVDALPNSDAGLVYGTFNRAPAASLLFDNAATAAFCDAGIALAAAAPSVQQNAGDVEATSSAPRRKRRRRARSCKSKEEAEIQRMTHIAVERNRRRQMNEYLAVLRSLMPEAYVQRGDQASIVGGAIEFVKELEQQLQSLEAQKRTLAHHRQHYNKAKPDAMPTHAACSSAGAATATPTACVVEPATTPTSNCSSSVTEDAHSDAPPFARFFTYPQYVWCHRSPRDSAATTVLPGVADVEVSLVETHASVRVMAPRQHGKLLKMVAGLQALRLTVLHLTVTTLDALALYTLSIKIPYFIRPLHMRVVKLFQSTVEEGCGLTTVDDISAAVHHVLCIIDADAVTQQMLGVGAVGH